MKILFDTDIGSDIDDALALLLLLRMPEVQLVGVTTVYGQTDIRAKVAKKILLAAGCCAPVVAGYGTPFGSPDPVWHAGTEGDGILTDGERTASLESMKILQRADDFIVEAVEEHGEDLTVVSLGALTNIAAALRREPALESRMARLFFMGGGVAFPKRVPHNFKPGRWYRAHASHNIRCDVVAAKEVLASGIPMAILTNDVTTRLWWDGAPVQKLLAATTPPEAKLVGSLLKVWLDYRTRIFEEEVTGTCLHDPLTIAEATQTRFVTYVRGEMRAHRDATTGFISDPQGLHLVGVSVETEAFLSWFSETITDYKAEPNEVGNAPFART